MRKFLFLIVIFYCFIPTVFSQEIDIKSFIKAWSVSDTSQTHRAEETYKYIKKGKSVSSYQQILKQLNAYHKENPDNRLLIRITMFDVFGKIELNTLKRSQYPQEATRILDCIKLANKLDDDQLMAELYAQYAEVSLNASTYVLYNLKAIELQQKVGVNHFSYVANRYYNVAYGLYLNEDFRQSIDYGLKYLSIKNKNVETEQYLLMLINDVIGASYYQLNMLDSTTYYYQKILINLEKRPLNNINDQQLWLGIAKGNIGRVLSVQNQDDKALPLIKEHLSNSLSVNSYNNAAKAENNLGAIYLKNKSFEKAKIAYRNANQYAKFDNNLKELILAYKGLADVFKATNNLDSAFEYASLYQKNRDSLIIKINGGKLSAIKANLEFDNMTTNLKDANHAIKNHQLVRNLILITIILLTIIAILFYNRKMLQQKNIASILKHEQTLLAQEAIQAKIEVKKFMERIADKNMLIANLQEKLTKDNEQINSSLLNYTLVTDQDWESFRVEFSKAYPEFLPKLKIALTLVNPAEERLAALLYIKTTTIQIANTLGISKDSVSRSKRRLKQRLNLESGVQLEDFISNLG